MDAMLVLLESSAMSQALRASIWVYPLVNAAHIVGLGLLFGSIVPLDLRLAGLWPRVPWPMLSGILTPVALSGLGVAVASGALLFAARPTDYVAEPMFLWKLGLIAVALVNALALRRLMAPRRDPLDHTHPMPTPARWAGVASLLLWSTVIVLGRLIGYR